MSLPQLRQALAADGITPGNVGQLAVLSDAWFMADPSPVSLSVRCILRNLHADWDGQAIPTEDYEPVRVILLPAVTEAAAAAASGDAARVAAALDGLAVAYRDCCR